MLFLLQVFFAVPGKVMRLKPVAFDRQVCVCVVCVCVHHGSSERLTKNCVRGVDFFSPARAIATVLWYKRQIAHLISVSKMKEALSLLNNTTEESRKVRMTAGLVAFVLGLSHVCRRVSAHKAQPLPP